MYVANRKDSTQLLLDILDAQGESFDTNTLSAWKESQISRVKNEVERILEQKELIQEKKTPVQKNVLDVYDRLPRKEQRAVRKQVLEVLTNGRENHVTIQSLPSVVASVETLGAVAYKSFLDEVHESILTVVHGKQHIDAVFYLDIEILEIFKLLNRGISWEEVKSQVIKKLQKYGVALDTRLIDQWGGIFVSINEKLLQEYGELLEHGELHRASRNLSYVGGSHQGGEEVLIHGFDSFQLQRAYLENELLQSQEKNRSIVELASNSIDATPEGAESKVEIVIKNNGFTITDNGEGMTPYVLLEKLIVPKMSGKDGAETIGRFGIGFYTALAHLKKPSDSVKVITNNGEETFEITFFRNAAAKTTSILHELSIQTRKIKQGSHSRGTSIALECDEYDPKDAEMLLRNTMHFSSKMPINLRAEYRGSSDHEQINGKKGFEEVDMGNNGSFLYTRNTTDTCKVTLLVKDITIEELSINGLNLPKELVINFPARCVLSESRSEIGFDQNVILTLEAIINALSSMDVEPSVRLSLFNVLQRTFRGFDKRFTRKQETHLHKRLKKSFEENFLQQGHVVLPNNKFFGQFNIKNAIYADEAFFDFNPDDIGAFEKVESWRGTEGQTTMYLVDFIQGCRDWIVQHGNTIFVDRATFISAGEDLSALNVYFSDLDVYTSGSEKTRSGYQDRPEMGKLYHGTPPERYGYNPNKGEFWDTCRAEFDRRNIWYLGYTRSEEEFWRSVNSIVEGGGQYPRGYWGHKHASRKIAQCVWGEGENIPPVDIDKFLNRNVALNVGELVISIPGIGAVEPIDKKAYREWNIKQDPEVSEEHKLRVLSLALYIRDHVLTQTEFHSLSVSTSLEEGRGFMLGGGENPFKILLEEIDEILNGKGFINEKMSFSWRPAEPPEKPWDAETKIHQAKAVGYLRTLSQESEFWRNWMTGGTGETFLMDKISPLIDVCHLPSVQGILKDIEAQNRSSEEMEYIMQDLRVLAFFIQKYSRQNNSKYGEVVYFEEVDPLGLKDWKDINTLIPNIWHVIRYMGDNYTQGRISEILRAFGFVGRSEDFDALWDAIVTGKYEEVPKELRSFAIIMNEGGDILQTWQSENILETDEAEGICMRLSSLMATKSLAQKKFKGIHAQTDLEKILEETNTRSYNALKQLRDIRHAVDFQIVNDRFLWIREMLQNSIDAIHEEKVKTGEGGGEKPKIQVNAYAEKEHLVTEIRDPVGMSYSTVVNYLFIVGESTKRTKEGLIGAFGQGFMTILKDAETVKIKTSTGDGNTTYITVKPIKTGDFTDYTIDIKQVKEDFKGTQIQQWIQVEDPVAEAANCKSSVMQAGGLIDASDANVEYGGEQVNTERTILSERIIPMKNGKSESLRVYTGKENAVAKNGLYVSDIDEKYWEGVPEVIAERMKKAGMVISVPGSFEVIRGRGGFVDEKGVLVTLRKYLPSMILEAYIRCVAEKKVPFPEVPYDLNSEPIRLSYEERIPDEVKQDSVLLSSAGTLTQERLAHYAGNIEDLTRLLVLIPLFDIDGNKGSYLDLKAWEEKQRKQNEHESRQREFVPSVERKREEKKKDNEKKDTKEESRETFDKSDYEEVTHLGDVPVLEGRKDLIKNFPTLYFIHDLLSEILPSLGGPPVDLRVYWGTTKYGRVSMAHCVKGVYPNWIGFNLEYIARQLHPKVLNISRSKGKIDSSEVQSLLESLIFLLSHELRHAEERSDEETHNRGFFLGQRKLLSNFIQNKVNFESIISRLLRKYKIRGNEQFQPEKYRAMFLGEKK